MKFYKSKPWLQAKYESGMSLEAIAKEAGCSVQTIYNWLLQHKIIEKNRTWTR